jgi:NADH-quinone oxidoreductase subunit A
LSEHASQQILWPILVYSGAVILLVTSMVVLSYLLGQKHREHATGEPYESGMPITGTARVRFDIKFYLMAMYFVIFDIEAAFIFAWAVSLREAGWAGYIEMLVFICVLGAALVYLWRMGTLEWGTSSRLKSTEKAKRA